MSDQMPSPFTASPVWACGVIVPARPQLVVALVASATF
jgi:hypothetical protein